MIMSFKKMYLWLVGLILIIIWILCANSVVSALFLNDEERVKRTHIEKYSSKADVITYITGENDKGDIFDTYQINGIAFCELQAGTFNNNRELFLVLKSDKRTYEIAASSVTRVDAYYDLEGSCEMANGNIGFQTEFSTINVADGIYDAYVYVKENDDVCGIENTGSKYIKDKYGFRSYEYGDVDKLQEAVSDGVEYQIEGIASADNKITIEGKAYLESIKWQDADIYCTLSTDGVTLITAELEKKYSIDNFKMYGKNYLMSGFEGTVNLESVDSYMYDIDIWVSYDGNVYSAIKTQQIEWVDGEWKLK